MGNSPQIQILGMRYFDANNNKAFCFLNNGWRAPNVQDIFRNYELYLELIPKDQHFNLFFTAAHCKEDPKKQRDFVHQACLMIDIDGIDNTRHQEYVDPICAVLKCNFEQIGIIRTGNGFHICIALAEPITNKRYFKENKHHYAALCDQIDKELKSFSVPLPGACDKDVFKPGVMFRMPGTKNIKTPETGYKNKNSVKDVIVEQRIVVPIEGFDLKNYSSTEFPNSDEGVGETGVVKKFRATDSDFVLSECRFLQHCMTHQESGKVSEPQWFKAIGITANFSDSEKAHEITHAISKKDPRYSFEETEEYYSKAITAKVPPTCKSIEQVFPECEQCPHYRKIKSPILLTGDDFIATQTSNFRNLNAKGMPGSVNFDDLLKYYNKINNFKVVSAKNAYKFVGTHWEVIEEIDIERFVEENVKPAPKGVDVEEFKKKLYRSPKNAAPKGFFHKTIEGRINLKNGVLDITKGKPSLIPHSDQYGFTSVCDYDYDPNAKCTRFDQFLDEVSKGNDGFKEVLMEYAGYILANGECTFQKCMILTGVGSNGKSTFLDVMRDMVGQDNFSAVSLSKISKDTYSALYHDKALNICEEAPHKSLLDSSDFKNIIAGGDIPVKMLYKQPYFTKNKTKFIISCNELPYNIDNTHGFYRRLIILPFDARFDEANIDVDIKYKLKKESSGILNRIIEGYLRLMKQKRFSTSKTLKNIIDRYKEENNPILVFRNDYIIKKDGAKIDKDIIFEKFLAYCERNNMRHHSLNITSRKFHNELKKIEPGMSEPDNNTRLRDNGSRKRYYLGYKYIEDNGTIDF